MNFPEFVYTVLLKPKFLKVTANWFLKKIIPSTVKIDGAIIHLNPNDPVVSGALTLNVFEKDEVEFFKKYFNSNMTFLDVGANVGLYSGLALSRNNFCGKVICMEPHDESTIYLKKTLADNKKSLPESNVILSPMAASDYQGAALLHINSENKGDNRLYSDELLDAHQNIFVTTIDQVCEENNVDSIDFIKIDIQGAEEKAINGASSVLQNSTDCILLSELWPYGLSQYKSSLSGYISTLEKYGFKLFKLEKQGMLSTFNIKEIEKEYNGPKDYS